MGRSRWKSREKIRLSGESVSCVLGVEIVRVLVGSEQHEFAIHKKLLLNASDYFADLIATSPTGVSIFTTSHFTSSSSFTTPSSTSGKRGFGRTEKEPTLIWMASESPAMFELFVLWLYQRRAGLMRLVDEATAFGALPERAGGGKSVGAGCCAMNLHWSLARLHVFAARTGVEELQDLALDALQDVYLRCDWGIAPRFVRFIYAKCDPDHAFRLRMWTVAMVAWTLATRDVDLQYLVPSSIDEDNSATACSKQTVKLASKANLRRSSVISETKTTRNAPPVSPTSTPLQPSPPASKPAQVKSPPPPVPLVVRRFINLLAAIPDFREDFEDHVSSFSRTKQSAALKNPSLRLPSNSLRSGGRNYGFRMCSFHAHRSEVGQGECPHLLATRTPMGARWSFAGATAMGASAASFGGSMAYSNSRAFSGSMGFGSGAMASGSTRGARRRRFRGSESDTSSASSTGAGAIATGLASPGPFIKFGSDSES